MAVAENKIRLTRWFSGEDGNLFGLFFSVKWILKMSLIRIFVDFARIFFDLLNLIFKLEKSLGEN